VQVGKFSSRQPIILPSTGMRVCLMTLLHFPFCAIELRQVADLGSHPYGLTGCEVGCLVVECHRFGFGSFGSYVSYKEPPTESGRGWTVQRSVIISTMASASMAGSFQRTPSAVCPSIRPICPSVMQRTNLTQGVSLVPQNSTHALAVL